MSRVDRLRQLCRDWNEFSANSFPNFDDFKLDLDFTPFLLMGLGIVLGAVGSWALVKLLLRYLREAEAESRAGAILRDYP